MSTPDPLPRRSGVHKLDIVVGACALLISVVSLFVAYRSNQVQERMLAASVWPYLAWDTSNYREDLQQEEVSLEIRNLGVGPARIESLQLNYKGQPVGDFRQLVMSCCKAEVEHLGRWSSRTSTINPIVIPAHDSIKFFAIIKNADNAALWDAFNRERFNVEGRVCYCSVLDNCWLLRSGNPVPESVSRCPAPAAPEYH